MVFFALFILGGIIMRISSVILASLFIFSVSPVFAESSKGYVKDSQGRTLVYRAQPSWWLIPSGTLLTGLGAFVTYGAYHEVNPQINLNGSLKLGDIWPDLHKVLANIRMHIPLNNLDGTPARAIKCALGTGITLSGAAILYSWLSNYAKLSKPFIVIDHEGLQYEGKDKINWKDVKSVRVVHDTAFNWNNGTGKLKRKYALEIVNVYDRLLISECDIAITVETLQELIKQYFRRW